MSDMSGASQCFPLYLYGEQKKDASSEDDLFANKSKGNEESTAANSPSRKHAITDAALAHFQSAYPATGEGDTIGKEDLFYYIYGILHAEDYRERFQHNLNKELPRIPPVKAYADFRAFEAAGRELAALHLGYETVEPADLTIDITGPKKGGPLSALAPDDFRVEKMKFGKTRDANGKSIKDKTVVIYNPHLTLRDIPPDAYGYVVNGKSAIEWVMERQAVTTDKKSGIVNDANRWAIDTMGDARYPFDLLRRIVTVSLETLRIVRALPKVEWEEKKTASKTLHEHLQTGPDFEGLDLTHSQDPMREVEL